MSDDNPKPPQAFGGLTPQYPNYVRQKCFIGYSQNARWAEDLLAGCEAVLNQPEFNLELDYAHKNPDPNRTLRDKALELIANARYGIYDLSEWRDGNGKWQLPRNVYIELGMAIALNRPTLLLRHKDNVEAKRELPECLKTVSEAIVPWSGEPTLKRELPVE